MRTERRVRRWLATIGAAALVAASGAPARGADWALDGVGVKNKTADFRLGLTGYVQVDARHYFDWTSADPLTKPIYDTVDVRRMRTGLELEWHRLTLEWDFDWAGDLRDLVGDDNVEYPEAEMKDLYAQYEFSKAFALKAGAFKIPVSPEFLTSASKTDFVERSLLALSLAPDREWGVAALGRIGDRLDYTAGVFKGDGRVGSTRAETTFAARLVFEPVEDLALGGSFAQGNVEAEPDGPGTDPAPKGFAGRSPTSYRFYERKFVDGRRLRWGFDAAWTRGPLSLRGEFLQGREERLGQSSIFTDLPEQIGNGWAFTANWILTGEKKTRTLKPERTLFGGPGLIELSARYEEIRFDDAGPNEGFEGAGNRASNLRPAGDRVFWAGVSWLPKRFMRLYADFLWETYRDALLAPEPPGAVGLDHEPTGAGTYLTFMARLQFMIP